MRRLTRLCHPLRLIPHVNLPARVNLPAHGTGCIQDLITVYQVPEVPPGAFPWRMGVLTTFQLEPAPFPFLDLWLPEGVLHLGDPHTAQGRPLPLITY